MKRKKISNERFDPSLTNGYGYFVAEAGYKEHLARNTGLKQEVCSLASSSTPADKFSSLAPAFRMMQSTAPIRRKHGALL